MVDITKIITASLNYIQTDLASAIIILLVGFIISYLLGKILRRVLKEIEVDNIAYRTFNLRLKLEKRISIVVTYLLYIVTVIVALTRLKIGNYVLIGILIVVGVLLLISLLLNAYDFIPNFLTGIIVKNNIKPGDKYSYKSIKGIVKKISLINVIIETSDNNYVFIPNKTVRKSLLKK